MSITPPNINNVTDDYSRRLNNGEIIWLYGTPTKEIKHIDYKHGIHIKAKSIPKRDKNKQIVRVNGNIEYLHKNDDASVYKVRVVYTDGTEEPHLILHKNYKRTVYVERKRYKDIQRTKPIYKDKVEHRELKYLKPIKATESEVISKLAKELGITNRTQQFRLVKNSPFVYGLEIPVTSTIKHSIRELYGQPQTTFSIATLDGEWDVDSGVVSIMTICTEESIYTYINRSLLAPLGLSDRELYRRIFESYSKYRPDEALPVDRVNLFIVENELEVVLETIKRAHKIKPDFLVIFNIEADLPKILSVLKKNNLDPKDIFSDPTIPPNYRYFKYVRGSSIKVTDSGKTIPIPYFQQWHYAHGTSSFFIIDQMLAYYQVRVGGKNIPGGYGLDNLLLKNKINAKLKFKDEKSENLIKAQWHKYMVKHRPIEYIVYNIWDTYSMIVLDKKTKDLNTVIPILANISEIYRVNSGPKKIVDALHYYFLSKGHAIGVKSMNKITNRLLGLSGWILIMDGYRIAGNGLSILKEESEGSISLNSILDEHIPVTDEDREAMKLLEEKGLPLGSEPNRSNVRVFTGDNDIVSSYPSVTETCNVSNVTTIAEVAKIRKRDSKGNIEPMDRTTFMRQNINLFIGGNGVEWCCNMLNYPTLTEFYQAGIKRGYGKRKII